MVSNHLVEKERALNLEELKLAADEFRYRDQLMVTEFALTMTAVGLAGNIAVRLADEPGLRIFVILATSIYLFIIAVHLTRVDRDRRLAHKVKERLQRGFNMKSVAKDHVGSGFSDAPPANKLIVWFSKIPPATKLMVGFSYALCGGTLILAVWLIAIAVLEPASAACTT